MGHTEGGAGLAEGLRAEEKRGLYMSLMNARPAEPELVKFLRAALAEQARPVTKLEASARAAGLLGEAQSITDAKAFKQANRGSAAPAILHHRRRGRGL